MDQFVALLKEVNIAQIFIIFAGMWFSYNRSDKKIDKLDARIDKINDRIDKLSEKVEDIDRRLCRIEGSLSIHGHCLFNQAHQEKKAE